MNLNHAVTSSLAAMATWFTAAGIGHSDVILSFGQTAANATVTATTNGVGGITIQPTAGTIPVLVDFGSGLTAGFLGISLSSTGSAANILGVLAAQLFSGNFAITQNSDGSGTNFLSSSLITGVLTGSIANPSNFGFATSLDPVFTSDVITSLETPTGLSLSLSVIPSISGSAISGGNIRPFTAAVAGVASGTASPVPEPSMLSLAALAALVTTFHLRRRRRVEKLVILS